MSSNKSSSSNQSNNMDIDKLTELILNALEEKLQTRPSLTSNDINEILMKLWESGLNNYGFAYINARTNKLEKLQELFREIVRICNRIQNGDFDHGYIDIY